MSKMRTTSAAERSEYLPEFKSAAERERYRAELLEEWETLAKLRQLRPATGERSSDG